MSVCMEGEFKYIQNNNRNEDKLSQSRSVLNWFGLLVLISDWAQTLEMHWLREKKGWDY